MSNIGDAVMTTPTLERVHQLYPEAVIDLVCDPRSQILFEHCPYRGNIFLKQKKLGRKGLFKLIGLLRKKRYDLIVDLRTDGLAYLLRAKKRLTKFGHRAYGPHAVEDLVSIIDRINPGKQIPPTRIWLDSTHLDKADELTSSLPGEKWLAIGPGANWEPKTWGGSNFAEVANQSLPQIDAAILVGGPGDSRYARACANSLELPYIDLTGKTDLLTTSAIIQKCSVFVGNDSGLGHLASAVDTPSVTVFGPGNPQRYHPWHQGSMVISGQNQTFSGISSKQVARQVIALSER